VNTTAFLIYANLVGHTLAVLIYENLVGHTLAVLIYENLIGYTTSSGDRKLLLSQGVFLSQ
jgi:hypothetical protein